MEGSGLPGWQVAEVEMGAEVALAIDEAAVAALANMDIVAYSADKPGFAAVGRGLKYV
jgi:hypothetical protein